MNVYKIVVQDEKARYSSDFPWLQTSQVLFCSFNNWFHCALESKVQESFSISTFTDLT